MIHFKSIFIQIFKFSKLVQNWYENAPRTSQNDAQTVPSSFDVLFVFSPIFSICGEYKKNVQKYGKEGSIFMGPGR